MTTNKEKGLKPSFGAKEDEAPVQKTPEELIQTRRTHVKFLAKQLNRIQSGLGVSTAEKKLKQTFIQQLERAEELLLKMEIDPKEVLIARFRRQKADLAEAEKPGVLEHDQRLAKIALELTKSKLEELGVDTEAIPDEIAEEEE